MEPKMEPKAVEFYTKAEVITAIRWMFGFTRKKALEYFAETDYKIHNAVAHAFKMNARKAFYAD